MENSDNVPMQKSEIDRIVDNEREWRLFTLNKIESMELRVAAAEAKLLSKITNIDKELATFKIRVAGFALIFGGVSGAGAEYLKKFFLGI